MNHDVIVIGGGAAGLLCAIEAGKRGRSVIVLEHAERIGKKISISGGGRCNFTNIHTTPEISSLQIHTSASPLSLVTRPWTSSPGGETLYSLPREKARTTVL